MTESANGVPEDITVLDLSIEDAGEAGCLGHVPELPGLCFRALSPSAVERAAAAQIREYLDWLNSQGLTDLTPTIGRLTRSSGFRIPTTEHVAGAPVWESGNPAVLLDRDLRPLDDEAVSAHLRFVRRVLDRIREDVSSRSEAERTRRPAPDRRSFDETMEHIGNCVWWYCSRIDDDLPEPDEPEGEDPLDRIDRLFPVAEAFLLDVPFADRTRIHVPTRFPTADPTERWTHAKVCRRQAEHVWAHLPGLESAEEALDARVGEERRGHAA